MHKQYSEGKKGAKLLFFSIPAVFEILAKDYKCQTTTTTYYNKHTLCGDITFEIKHHQKEKGK